MKLAGLDISLNCTGWCIYDTETGVRTSDVIRSNGIRGYRRIANAVSEIAEVLKNVDAVVIEDLALGRFMPKVHTDVIGLTYMVRMWLLRHDKIAHLISPMSLKKFATGNGKADKSTMRLAVFKRWGVDTQDLTDDIADAVALCEVARAIHEPGYRCLEFQVQAIAKAKKMEW